MVYVLQVVQMPLNRELNVPACDDLAAQNSIAVVADAGCMVSGCHAGDVDSRCVNFRETDQERLSRPSMK